MPPHPILLIDPTPGGQMGNGIVIERTTFRRIQLQQLLEADALKIRRIKGIDGDTIPQISLAPESIEERARRQRRVTRHHDVNLTSRHGASDRVPDTGLE